MISYLIIAVKMEKRYVINMKLFDLQMSPEVNNRGSASQEPQF